MRSPYFAAADRRRDAERRERPLDAPDDATPCSKLAALQSRKRKQRSVHAVDAEEPPQLTEMEKQVVALRRLHPDTLLLFECGYRMRLFAEDAENAATVLGIRAQRRRAFVEASVPVHRTLFHARKLVHAGFKVGVVRQTDSAAMRAATKAPGAARKPLERCVAEVYTRATIPEVESRGEDTDDEEEMCARFVACVVEVTVHSKPFFSQSMHDLDEEVKRSQVFSEEVRIGVFMHDVHTGESKFDEFEDGGKRQKLQRILETLDPVEFVLPAGKLSAYTEQILENFVASQSDGTALAGEEALQSCVRVERVPNKCFEYAQAKETFTRVFVDVEDGQMCSIGRPRLPMLCVCCFGGMCHYLTSLGLAKTLVAPSYLSMGSSAEVSGKQFYLPVEAHRDLDLFVNAVNKPSRCGLAFSILNHTKTHAGARRLREWIRSPLSSVPEILDRQRTIASLAFPAGSLSMESLPHRIAYEELTTVILPRCKHLLKFLQQIHISKASPVQAIGALQILQDLGNHIEALKNMFAQRSGISRVTATAGQTTLLERLLVTYPKMSARIPLLCEEIDIKYAKRNDVERTIQKRLRMKPFQARKYQELSTKLKTLADQYEAVLLACRTILKKPSLAYTTFRGGSLSDIHHLVEVHRTELHDVPPGWLVVNSTKKLVRFHPKEIIQLHLQEEFVKEQKEQLVRSAWRRFVGDVDAQIYVVGMTCVDILANLDALCSLATVAQSYPNYTPPEFVDDDSSTLKIVDGRHPIIETLLVGSSYISNSVLLSSTATSPGSLLVVSGPNMGGKSSLLRMCALMVILAQIGSYVPATSFRLSVFDGIYTHMHRSSKLFSLQHRILPPCAQELTALGSISRNATWRSLVLIDEIGFGMAAHLADTVGVAQMRYLVDTVGCHVVLATHLTAAIQKLQARLGTKCQTKQLEYHFYDNAGVERDEGCASTEPKEIATFHYLLKDGIASDSFAIETARRAGVAEHILQRAQNLRENF